MNRVQVLSVELHRVIVHQRTGGGESIWVNMRVAHQSFVLEGQSQQTEIQQT